jgi:hypothetical protein
MNNSKEHGGKIGFHIHSRSLAGCTLMEIQIMLKVTERKSDVLINKLISI